MGDRFFLNALKNCYVVCDFHDSDAELAKIERKSAYLRDVLRCVKSRRGLFTEAVSSELVKMISANLFRTLPRSENLDVDADEDRVVFYASWEHLEVVYNIFLKFMESPEFEASLGAKVIDAKFVRQILRLFESEDPRERERLREVLCEIYFKVPGLRSFIWTEMTNVVLKFIYECECFIGIREVLDVLYHIISDFAVPLTANQRQFMLRVLLPLHKVKCLHLCNVQLCGCVVTFIDKDSSLTEPVVRGLLRYWPKTDSQKEIFFLSEVAEILKVTVPEEFSKIQVPLLKQISACLSSAHFQVAEKALGYWKDEHILELFGSNAEVVIGTTLPALYEMRKSCSSETTASRADHALKALEAMNKNYFDTVMASYEARRVDSPISEEEAQRRREKEEIIKKLENLLLKYKETG